MDGNSFFESKTVRIIALVGAVLAAATKLVDLVISSHPTVQTATTVILLLIGIYLLLAMSQELFKLNRLASRIVDKIEELTPSLSSQPSTPTSKNTPAVDEDEQCYGTIAERYGIGYDSLDVECVIAEDGSAMVTRRVQVDACSEIGELDTFLLIRESAPTGEERYIDLIEARSLTPDWDVSVTDVRKEYGRLSALVAISPPLTEDQNVGYELKEQLPAGLYAIDLTKEQIKERETPYEYFGWNINRPTRKLTLTVYFPEAINRPATYGAEVWIASASGMPSNRVQHEEQKRLKRPVLDSVGGRYFLRLSVDYPMIGLIYILRWQPLTTQETTEPTEHAITGDVGSVRIEGIPPDIYSHLYLSLLDCGPFESDSELQTVFVDERLSHWRDGLPEADNSASRVKKTIGYLLGKVDRAGENGLALFLRVLGERLDANDACRQRLIELSAEISGMNEKAE